MNKEAHIIPVLAGQMLSFVTGEYSMGIIGERVTQGSIPGLLDHDLSQRQKLN